MLKRLASVSFFFSSLLMGSSVYILSMPPYVLMDFTYRDPLSKPQIIHALCNWLREGCSWFRWCSRSCQLKHKSYLSNYTADSKARALLGAFSHDITSASFCLFALVSGARLSSQVHKHGHVQVEMP